MITGKMFILVSLMKTNIHSNKQVIVHKVRTRTSYLPWIIVTHSTKNSEII